MARERSGRLSSVARMAHREGSLRLVVMALALAGCAQPRRRGADVLTQHDDPARSGVTDAEPRLTPALLSAGGFGRLFERRVDGGVVAQPLFIKDVPTA